MQFEEVIEGIYEVVKDVKKDRIEEKAAVIEIWGLYKRFFESVLDGADIRSMHLCDIEEKDD